MPPPSTSVALVAECAGRLCALPLARVVETMRPLPIVSVTGAPPGVLGIARIRGVPTVVVELAAIVGPRDSGTADAAVAPLVEVGAGRSKRWVTIALPDRTVALAVDRVRGIRSLPPGVALPPLLRSSDAGAVAAIAERDRDLVWVLSEGMQLPSETETAA